MDPCNLYSATTEINSLKILKKTSLPVSMFLRSASYGIRKLKEDGKEVREKKGGGYFD